jgi:hypothetical protein
MVSNMTISMSRIVTNLEGILFSNETSNPIYHSGLSASVLHVAIGL